MHRDRFRTSVDWFSARGTRRTWFAVAVWALVALCSVGGSQAWSRDDRFDRAIGTVRVAELPREGRETLALIHAGGPFASHRDGVVFANRERLLPARPRGYYAEYTVRTPGERTRGARRIIAGRGDGGRGEFATSGEYYYTDDHYQSFRRIAQ